MKCSPEILRLPQPLHGLRCVRVSTRAAEEQARRDRELADAYERGRIEGEKQLSEQLLRQRKELLDLQAGVLQSLRQTLPQLARQTEQGLVQLALEAARKVVSSIPISPEMIASAVRESLAQVEDTAGLVVQLNPEDLSLLQQAGSTLVSAAGQSDLRFEASPDITRGGCRVKTRFGIIDAQRETKWNQLQHALSR